MAATGLRYQLREAAAAVWHRAEDQQGRWVGPLQVIQRDQKGSRRAR
jgi:hypothetical protein